MQASFDPPGLSIAVKKDRAVETMLVTGNKFNVNVLAQGKEKVLPLFTACDLPARGFWCAPFGMMSFCTKQSCMIGSSAEKLVLLLQNCVFVLCSQPSCCEA